MSDVVTRHRVTEWRFDTSWNKHNLRWWIESDPNHGGIYLSRRDDYIKYARLWSRHLDDELGGVTELVGENIGILVLNTFPEVNSIEVIDSSTGVGVAMHRDWP